MVTVQEGSVPPVPAEGFGERASPRRHQDDRSASLVGDQAEAQPNATGSCGEEREGGISQDSVEDLVRRDLFRRRDSIRRIRPTSSRNTSCSIDEEETGLGREEEKADQMKSAN